MNRLRQLRESKGLTQEELAKRIGIQRSTYSNYEIGKREPDFQTVERLAEFFDVSVDYILGRTEIKKKDPVDKLIEYLDLELTDEEIIERMTFKVDDMVLSEEDIKEFIAFVRAKRFMKSGHNSSKKEGL